AANVCSRASGASASVSSRIVRLKRAGKYCRSMAKACRNPSNAAVRWLACAAMAAWLFQAIATVACSGVSGLRGKGIPFVPFTRRSPDETSWSRAGRTVAQARGACRGRSTREGRRGQEPGRQGTADVTLATEVEHRGGDYGNIGTYWGR